MPSTPFHKVLKEQISSLQGENERLNNNLEAMNRKIEELNEEIRALREQNLRFSADVENFQKATQMALKDLEIQASTKILMELLPVLDSLDNASDESSKVIKSQLMGILSREGLEVVDSVDVKFDPNVHEAIGTVDGGKDGHVAKIIRNGYKFKGKLLRPALVLIGKEVK